MPNNFTTFVDSYGRKRTVPRHFHLRKRSMEAVLQETFEVIQRTSSRYSTYLPLISLEHVGLELNVSFSTMFSVFKRLEELGLLKQDSVLKNKSPASPLKAVSLFKMLRKVNDTDLRYKEITDAEGRVQRKQGQKSA